MTNDAFAEKVIATQDAALARLQARDFGGMVLGFVDRVVNQPRLPHPVTNRDFWDQVKIADELEDMRAHRPAAFQALPAREDQR